MNDVSHAGNFLFQAPQASLVIVQVDLEGKPDSISYWQSADGKKAERAREIYRAGLLLDIIA